MGRTWSGTVQGARTPEPSSWTEQSSPCPLYRSGERNCTWKPTPQGEKGEGRQTWGGHSASKANTPSVPQCLKSGRLDSWVRARGCSHQPAWAGGAELDSVLLPAKAPPGTRPASLRCHNLSGILVGEGEEEPASPTRCGVLHSVHVIHQVTR